MDKPNKPYLEIIGSPIGLYRFRYTSEGRGSHGSLIASSRSSSCTERTFPSVRLHNWYGQALIQCSLCQIQKQEGEPPSLHAHSLFIQNRKDPHGETVSSPSIESPCTATFPGMRIISVKRPEVVTELLEKLISKAKFEFGRELTPLEMIQLQKKAEKEAETMNLNQASLCFEAYGQNNGQWVQICDPVFSTPINNLRSAAVGLLKIRKLSKNEGSVAGDEDLNLFTHKVDKKNIKVRFFEVDELFNQLIWEDWGIFTEADVHSQTAIALKTPAYRNKNINDCVKVYIQLYRPSDEAVSDRVEFNYKPIENYKRPCVPLSARETGNIPSIDLVPQADTNFRNSNSLEIDFDEMIKEFFTSSSTPDAAIFESHSEADANRVDYKSDESMIKFYTEDLLQTFGERDVAGYSEPHTSSTKDTILAETARSEGKPNETMDYQFLVTDSSSSRCQESEAPESGNSSKSHAICLDEVPPNDSFTGNNFNLTNLTNIHFGSIVNYADNRVKVKSVKSTSQHFGPRIDDASTSRPNTDDTAAGNRLKKILGKIGIMRIT